jgi:hypothetical protein
MNTLTRLAQNIPNRESIKWFIEDQTFSPLYDSAPLPSPSNPHPPSRQQVVSLSQSSYVSPPELTDWRRMGGGAKSYDDEKILALYKSLCRWFRFAQLAKGKKFRP